MWHHLENKNDNGLEMGIVWFHTARYRGQNRDRVKTPEVPWVP